MPWSLFSFHILDVAVFERTGPAIRYYSMLRCNMTETLTVWCDYSFVIGLYPDIGRKSCYSSTVVFMLYLSKPLLCRTYYSSDTLSRQSLRVDIWRVGSDWCLSQSIKAFARSSIAAVVPRKQVASICHSLRYVAQNLLSLLGYNARLHRYKQILAWTCLPSINLAFLAIQSGGPATIFGQLRPFAFFGVNNLLVEITFLQKPKIVIASTGWDRSKKEPFLHATFWTPIFLPMLFWYVAKGCSENAITFFEHMLAFC